MKCENKTNSLTVSIENSIFLENIPSGSGMSYIEDSIYIISDDSPYLFQLNNKFDLLRKITLTRGFEKVSRIEKPLKPDYESLAIYKNSGDVFLYGFGSGSLAEKRDSLVVIDVGKNESVMHYNLKVFYDKLGRMAGGVGREKLNIEGAVIHDSSLYLLNRGNNGIFVINIESFNNFLSGGGLFSSLDIKMVVISLPKKEGTFIGLSGCSVIPGTNDMLFSATAEETNNWVDDGEIMGSYIGVQSLDQLDKRIEPSIIQIEEGGETLLDKVESITVIEVIKNSHIIAFAVADNDDGTSKLFTLKITY